MRKKASTGHPTRPKQATLPANPILCTVVPATITANASDTDPLVTKAIQKNADLLLRPNIACGVAANVLHDPLGRQFGGSGFLAHLHPSMVTMSQKSSLPQTLTSVKGADAGRLGERFGLLHSCEMTPVDPSRSSVEYLCSRPL